MIEIQPDMVFRRVAGIETNAAPDGVMVYQESRDKVHFLNQTAVIVFELCSMEKSVTDIETFIADGYALSTPPTEAVRTCLQSLLDEELIELCPPSLSAP